MFHDIDLNKKTFDAAIRIDDKDTEYRVKGKTHLRLVVYRDTKTLMVRHSFQGQRKVKKIGTFPMMKLPLFEQLANEFIEAMESGGNYSLALRATLDQYFYQIYLPDAKKNKRSWADDESRYRLYISPIIGTITLARIKPYHAEHVLNSLPEHLADRSHDLIRALMSVTFNKAISQELIDKNPCRTTSPKNNCNAVERYMDELEYTAFIKSCLVETDITSDQFSFQSLCLLFALFTGVRIDNCITLNRSMLSSCKTAVYLPTTKPNKPQTIYLSTATQWVIEQALIASDSEFLFPSSLGLTGHITHPASSFRRICKRAEIACAGSKHKVNPLFPSDNFKIHCLRKTFATVVLNYFSSSECFGLPISSLEISSQLLGHSSTRVTKKHYAFSDDKNLKLAVEVAAQVMIKLIPNFPSLKKATEH
jgi:integrase